MPQFSQIIKSDKVRILKVLEEIGFDVARLGSGDFYDVFPPGSIFEDLLLGVSNKDFPH